MTNSRSHRTHSHTQNWKIKTIFHLKIKSQRWLSRSHNTINFSQSLAESVISLITKKNLIFTHAPFNIGTIPPFNHYGILACHPSYRSYRMDTPPVPLRVVGLFFKFLIYLGYIISAGIAFSESQKVTKFGKKVLNLSDCLDSITHEIITDLYNLLTNGIFYAIFIVFYVGVAVEPNVKSPDTHAHIYTRTRAHPHVRIHTCARTHMSPG